ncbi:hypothetical protein NliqN6_4379 [Naganishia liquefaciens]|uniref:Uncharacterized protein n=1 Tax=Naganishia liquefaciens TaxID=104408 RepID=A0A8H3TVN0_9TREE|nr:hypothetical protein NliqN6_4379 [Naganishia liquefaciens]
MTKIALPRASRSKQSRCAASMLSRIAKHFGIGRKSNDEVAPVGPPVAQTTESSPRGRLAKQISLETTSSCATSAPSTFSSSTLCAGLSLSDSWTRKHLEAIPSTNSLLEDLAVEEAATAQWAAVVHDASPAALETSPFRDGRADAATLTGSSADLPNFAISISANSTDAIDGVPECHAASLLPAEIDPPPSATNASIPCKTLTWSEIFSSDSSSSSLCEIPWATFAASESSTNEGSVAHTAIFQQHEDESQVCQSSSGIQRVDEAASTQSQGTCNVKAQSTYQSSSALARIDEEDEEENGICEAQVQSLIDRDTSAHSTSAIEDVSIGGQGEQARPSVEWPTLTWSEVFSSDSTSSSLRGIIHGDNGEQAALQVDDALEDSECNTSDSIDSMYQPHYSPVYWYPVQLYSFSEAAHIFLFAEDERLMQPCAETRLLRITGRAEEDEDRNEESLSTLVLPIEAAQSTPAESADAHWPQLSWADIFSSDSVASSLSDAAMDGDQNQADVDVIRQAANVDPDKLFASSSRASSDAAGSITASHSHRSSSAGSLTLSATTMHNSGEDEDDDPFSAEQDRSTALQLFDTRQIVDKHPSISANPFIMHILQSATSGDRYRPDLISRANVLEAFLSFDTIIEEDEAEVHATSSASHDRLFAPNSNPFEYVQYSMEDGPTAICADLALNKE